MHVLIAGISTRAAAESAARAGFEVTALDAFADRDQHPAVRALSIRRHFGSGAVSAPAFARAATQLPSDAFAYVANFENHPAFVEKVARGRTLWGNRAEVLRRVRHPRLLADALQSRGHATPIVLSAAEIAKAAPERRWLVKPLSSGGGHRVQSWRPGTVVPARSYLQEYIEGAQGSVVFVAADGRTVPMGLSWQLVGEQVFGASGYRYCGNILVPFGDERLPSDETFTAAAYLLAKTVAEQFDLVGVSGVDFVERDGVPYTIEVNPRWTGSMELVECAYGLSVFEAHVAACRSGDLPTFDLARARVEVPAVGKAVVFSRRNVMTGDTQFWLEDETVRDVPWPGERILAGQPLCTVLASARDTSGCHRALVRSAERIYADVAAWEG